MSVFTDETGNAIYISEVMSKFKATPDESKRITEVMKATKPSKAVGSEYAWALYIRTGANKEGTFEDYMKYNDKIKSWEWEMLNRTFKSN